MVDLIINKFMKKLIVIFFVLLSGLCFSQNHIQPNFFWSYPNYSDPIFVLNSVSKVDISCSFNANVSIVNDGGFPITERGLVYNSSTSPTVANTKVTSGSGIGDFIKLCSYYSFSGTIYVRAYVINSLGTFYSNELTLSAYVGTYETDNVGTITYNSANIYGNVFFTSGSGIIQTTIFYDTTGYPFDNSTTFYTNSDGYFSVTLTGLSASSTYYYLIQSTYCNTTSSGGNRTFNTPATPVVAVLPNINTLAINGVTSSYLNVNSQIYSDGGAAITRRGVVINTSSITDTTTYIQKKGSTGTVGNYDVNFSSLFPSTMYYARAFAKNSVGVQLGQELLSTTLSGCSAPTVSTVTPTLYDYRTIIAGWNATADGGCSITEKGVLISHLSSLDINSYDSRYNLGGTGTGTGTVNLMMSASTTYYTRAYAINSAGIGYGSVLSISTTTAISCPILSTTALSSITATTASSGGNITSDGGSSVTARGVCWDTSPNPTISLSTKTSNGTGTGSFTSSVTGLTSGVTYYLKAYATNSAGTCYGNELTFTATYCPVITTAPVNSTTSTSMTAGYSISDLGGGDNQVTARGLCYSTTSNPPTISDSKTDFGAYNYTGAFISSITGLTPLTTYRYRAYVTNNYCTTYGIMYTFTTTGAIPTLNTTAITSITATTASSGGNTLVDNGSAISSKGIVWRIYPNIPAIGAGNYTGITSDGTGTANFTSYLTSLVAGTRYNVKSYATNSAGTGYGNLTSFWSAASYNGTTVGHTLNCPISIPYNITEQLKINSGGFGFYGYSGASKKYMTVTAFNANYDGDANSPFVLKYNGAAYTLNTAEDISGIADGGNSLFTLDFSDNGLLCSNNLVQSATITFYLTDISGIVGPSVTTRLEMQAQGTPTVTINSSVTSVTSTSALGGGNVTYIGVPPVTVRGLCWTTSPIVNPIITDPHTSDGSGGGAFSSNITGLITGTTYYVRAYAYNGTYYYSPTKISFTTNPPPSITSINDVDYTSSATSFVATLGSGAAAGDILFVSIHLNTNSTITTPTGYSQIYKISSDVNFKSFAIYYKIATSGDLGASVTISLGSSSYGNISIISVHGKSVSPYYIGGTYYNGIVTSITAQSPGGITGSLILSYSSISFASTGTSNYSGGYSLFSGLNLGNSLFVFNAQKVQVANGNMEPFTITNDANAGTQIIQIQVLPY